MSVEKNNDGYLIEYVSLGGSMKVTALDPKTLLETSVIVPSSLSQDEASILAIRKLRYMQEKNKGGQ
jgi:hypothetical protein